MAGFISKETIDAINRTSDIVAIVGEYTKLERRSGNDYWGCCPFHGEKTASFHVDGDNKFYHCFGCHASGNVVKFVMEMEKVSYVDALTTLAKKSGIEIKYEDGKALPSDYKKDNTAELYIDLYERTASMFHYLLLETDQGKEALDYIKKRGLDSDTLEKFKIGYAPKDRMWLRKFLKSKNFTDDFLNNSGLFSKKYPEIALYSDRLMFPIFNRKGQVVAFGGRVLHPRSSGDPKYINSPEMIHYKKRETLFAFNFAKNSIRENKRVIFCEGYMDCIAYHMCGVDYAVAPLGTALTEEQIKIISSFVDTVYLSFDSDEAGQNATKRAIFMCRKFDLTVKVIRLQGGKDPAEIMLSYGKENLTRQVNGAILDSDYFLIRLGEKYPIDSPEGKTKASLEFFEYVDSLQSDIQKELCLEQLSQAYNLKPEAVKRDFSNRDQARSRIVIRQEDNKVKQNPIKLNAEIRGLVAVTADLGQFKILRSNLTEDDFQDPTAKKLFKILEECFIENAFSIDAVLERCKDESLVNLITEEISAGVYQRENVSVIVNDTIKLLKRNRLDSQRNKLLQQIRNYNIVTEEDKNQLNDLLRKKMELDTQVQSLQK